MKKKRFIPAAMALAFLVSACGCGGKGDVTPTGEINVWTASGTEKLLRDVDYSSRYETNELKLSAFRNEYESAQIMISSTLGTEEYAVEVSALKTASGEELPAEAFSTYHEKYISVTDIKDTNSPTSVGMYPDALLPMATAKKYGETKLTGKNQGVWITLKTPKEQAAGTYTGKFKVTVDGKSYDVPVSVTVHDYTLSDETHSKTSFAIDHDMLGWAELNTSVEMQEKYYETLLEYRVCGQNLPGNDMTYVKASGEQLERFLHYAAKYTQDPRCSTYNLPFDMATAVIVKDGVNKTINSVNFDEFELLLREMAKYSVEHKLNLFKKASTYFIFFDEYDLNGTADLANYNLAKATELCESLAAELAQTLECDDTELKEEIIASLADIRHKVVGNLTDALEVEKATCVPTIDKYHTEEGRALYENFDEKSYGENGELWCYTCLSPRTPNPTYHLEDILISSRLMGWMMYDLDIVGNLYWMTTLYSWRESAFGDLPLQDYYDTALRYPSANGDGFLFYPGRPYGIYGPVASLRLHSLRDGNEDYDLLYALEEKYQEAGVAEADFNALMEILSRNLYSGTQVRIRDALLGEFDNSRAALASLLEMAYNTDTVIKSINVEGSNAKITVSSAKETKLYQGSNELTATRTGTVNEYELTVPMAEAANYLDLTAKQGEKSYTLHMKLGGRNVEVGANALLEKSTMITAGEIAMDTIEGKEVLKISYAEDERYLAELNMREYRVDNSVNMITLNVYSYADDAIDLRILSKCAKSGGYVESYKTKLNKGWNKVEISVTALNCATLGQLQSLRLQIEKTSDIAIGEILIGG